MRVMVLASLLALALAGAAPARVNDDEQRQLALHTVKENVSDAIKLEKNAITLLKAGNVKGADQEIKNSKQLLDGAMGAAEALTPPSDLDRFVAVYPGDHNWEGLAHTMRLAYGEDSAALLTDSTSKKIDEVLLALVRKAGIDSLVSSELKTPMCSLLINTAPPPSVNGVPLPGGTQVDVEVSCRRPLKELVLKTPQELLQQLESDNAKQKAAMIGSFIRVTANGAKQAGVEMVLDPAPKAGTPLPIDVVPIAGDSHDEFFGERF